MGDTGQYRCHRPLEEMRREAPGCAALGLAAEPTLGFLPAGDEGGEIPWGGGLGCTPPAPSSSLCPPGGCWGRSTVEQPCPAPTVSGGTLPCSHCCPAGTSQDTPVQWGATSQCSPGISRALQLWGEQLRVLGQKEMPK